MPRTRKTATEPSQPTEQVTWVVRASLRRRGPIGIDPSLRDTMSLSMQSASDVGVLYTGEVPKLWNETVEEHRKEVRQAILETTAALVSKGGLAAVTMSQIAEETGIGRATLYK